MKRKPRQTLNMCSQTSASNLTDPWRNPNEPEWVGMDFTIPGADDRWAQILTWVNAKLPRDRREVWPYDFPGAFICSEDWAPRHDSERVEADCLREVLEADRAETIKAVLEKWGRTLEQVFHLRTDEEVRTARGLARVEGDYQEDRRKRPRLSGGFDLRFLCYAWKDDILRFDARVSKDAEAHRRTTKQRRDAASLAAQAKRQKAGEKAEVIRKNARELLNTQPASSLGQLVQRVESRQENWLSAEEAGDPYSSRQLYRILKTTFTVYRARPKA